MAAKYIRIGSMIDVFGYDDGDFDSAIETTDPIKAGTPVDPTDVIRLEDIGIAVGDVFGPAASTDHAVARFDGVTGKLLQDSVMILDDAGIVTGVAGLTITGNCILGLNSAVFQPTVDSTTFFQVLDADGGAPILSVDSTNERVGIGTASPGAKVDILSSNDTISLLLADASANAANKEAWVASRHYTNAEEPAAIFYSKSDVLTNRLRIGGGSNLMNAVTGIDFYTATNAITPTGTRRMRINSLGNITIGPSGAAGNGILDIQGAIEFQTDNLGTINQNMRLFFDESNINANYGFSLIYAGNLNPTFEGTIFNLPTNAFHIVRHNNAIAGQAAMTILRSNGNVGIGTTEPSEKLDINSDAIRIRTAQTPASAGAAGTTGMICWDADYIYVCTAVDTWKRAAITSW